MATTNHKTDVEILEDYRVALTNAVNQTEVSAALTEIGYDSSIISQGSTLLEKAFEVYNKNKQEDNETLDARSAFDTQKEAVEKMYMEHRKKAKVVFRKDEIALKKLALTGSLSRTYMVWLETVRTFYTVLNRSTDLQTPLARLMITPEVITAGLAAIEELESTRSTYLKEVGESQDATKAKEIAIRAIEEWMMDFNAVAKIAMEDKPQLLETLGILVRS